MNQIIIQSMEKLVTLISSEGESFQVSVQIAEQSQVIKAVLADDAEVDDVPLPKVSSVALRRILAILDHSLVEALPVIPKPLPSNKLDAVVPQWYATFLEALTSEDLFEMTKAADYLHIDLVLELCCAAIAVTIKDKSVEELRTFFKISPDLSAEEENAIRAENSWVER